ncbi:Potassium voltage-gated channel protein like [Actinidia chinensis var. chinensis]|uniref:Potassium voltage-gated channel protein like n=1 Tax=Actinidia chinensis var. chinensis TaxID=1590841 RepID=A0A2R6QT69_ACTCC|nr:Potassium voltage-gated channel protein like [Actinidia chinensis var. chinensis]
MSVERSFEAWEEVQRHGQDLADRLSQGFTGLIQSHITPPSFPWPNYQKPTLFEVDFPTHNFAKKDFGFVTHNSGINGVSTIFDIGNKLGQAGADIGAGLNGAVQQFFRRLPVPFRHDEHEVASLWTELNSQRPDEGVTMQEDLESVEKRLRDLGFAGNDVVSDSSMDGEKLGFNSKTARLFGKSQRTINVTYDSTTNNVEGSLVASGDLWRVEASHGSSTSTSGNENSSLFLVQLGLLFVRDSRLLLPVHLSKQHLLWYGYDRKNGMHSLSPVVWSKHRRWLLMSTVCLKPLACSFMDLHFPNGQITYVSGEGLSTIAFLPFCGGLLQVQGQYPGEMKFSFSCKNKWGTRITPTVQWPDKSFTLGLAQALAWKASGLIVGPTVQFSVCPTFGGSNPGLQAELIHSVNKELSLIYGCTFMSHPSAFASLSLARSKQIGKIGSSGIAVRVETPLGTIGRPSFSVKLNSGIEF